VSGDSRLVMVEQRRYERGGAVPWILDEGGCKTPGQDDGRRLAEVRAGLLRHPRVTAQMSDTSAQEIELTVSRLHEPRYLRALARVRNLEPVLMHELAQPGVEPDTPVCAEAVASAREGVGTAIAAAQRLAGGARFSYALCRPPGHHAGPGWLGGYCYLNNAVAAAQTLHEAGAGRVAILDIDLHYPNGTSALVASMEQTTLCSLHGQTGANLPWRRVRARTERERIVTFRSSPQPDAYIATLATSTRELARSADAIVLSLGYDTVAGDPHGSWSFDAPIFTRMGQLLAAAGPPVCVVQEGGYALESLAQCSHAFVTGLLDGSPQ
jgi:acetoin utilization deacetylase AcuC-like enzyme